MKAQVVLPALAAVVILGGGTAAAFAIGPSCPGGSYRNANPPTEPIQAGTISIPGCTSYATHVAPSSGVVIPRYATYMDRHLAERWEIGVASLLIGALLAGFALAQGRRSKNETNTSAAPA